MNRDPKGKYLAYSEWLDRCGLGYEKKQCAVDSNAVTKQKAARAVKMFRDRFKPQPRLAPAQEALHV